MRAWVAKLWVREFSTGTTLKQELLHRHRRGTRTRLRHAGVAAALRTMRNVDPNRTRPALTDHLARPLLLGVRDGRAPGSRATPSATACRKTFGRRGGSDWLPAPHQAVEHAGTRKARTTASDPARVDRANCQGEQADWN